MWTGARARARTRARARARAVARRAEPRLSDVACEFNSASANRRLELGVGLRATHSIRKGRTIGTTITRSKFNKEKWKKGLMIKDDDSSYGYNVDRNIVYRINSADDTDVRLTTRQRRLTANIMWYREKRGGRWELVLEALKFIRDGDELVSLVYMLRCT